jgi:hypothetical protein
MPGDFQRCVHPARVLGKFKGGKSSKVGDSVSWRVSLQSFGRLSKRSLSRVGRVRYRRIRLRHSMMIAVNVANAQSWRDKTIFYFPGSVKSGYDIAGSITVFGGTPCSGIPRLSAFCRFFC